MKTPLTPSITSPKGLEKFIQQFQARLTANLTWLDYVFGLAESEVIERDGRQIIRPVAYQGLKADRYVLFPNDALKSYSFFDMEDPIELKYGERAGVYKYAKIKVNLSVIFWVNLQRIENSDYRLTKSKLRIDILNCVSRKVKDGFTFIPLRTYEKQMTDIFRGYSLAELTDYAVPVFPYWAHRVEGEFWYPEECYTTNTYTR